MPEKINAEQKQKMIKPENMPTRQDYNRITNSLRRFLKKGAEQIIDVPDNKYNLKTTKWQLREMNMQAGVINRERNRRREEILQMDMTSRGEKLGYTRGALGMNKASEHQYAPINVTNPAMSRADFNEKIKTLNQLSLSTYWKNREQGWVDSYVQRLEDDFGESRVADIVESIRGLSFQEFRKIWEAEGDLREHYDPDNATHAREQIEHLRAVWINEPITKTN